MNEVNNFPLNNKEKENVDNLIHLLSSDMDIIGLIRYGSSVKSNMYQDIDLCIVSKNIELSSEKELKYRLFLPDVFDVHFFSSLPLYIQHEVLKEGFLEYCKDYEQLFDICTRSIKAFDLYEPRYRQFLEWIKNE